MAIITVTGNTDDLFYESESGEIKMARFFVDSDVVDDEDGEEIIDVTLTSTNDRRKHPIFDQLLGKNLQITVATTDE